MLRICVVGLGYVGSVTSVCLANLGHKVWGVDKDLEKVDRMANGVAPINEANLAENLQSVLEKDLLHITSDINLAIMEAEIALICVGTPTSESGGVNLDHLERTLFEIAAALQKKPHPLIVVVRSTVPPGTVESKVMPILENILGDQFGDISICFNPEFLREGSAIRDFYNPPYTVFGLVKEDQGVEVINKLEAIYKPIDAPTIYMGYREAELLKVTCNAFHALKICFANELGSIAASVGADPIRLMNAFVMDTKLNISPAYFHPGFAFGGSCLPKDLRSLVHIGGEAKLQLPLINSILLSNTEHLQRALDRILACPEENIGLVGLVFKANTDDVRESPALWLAKNILNAGRNLLIYEPEIQMEKLLGANLNYLRDNIADIDKRLVAWETLCERTDRIVITRDGVVGQKELGALSVKVITPEALNGLDRKEKTI